jgi:hypothetical protein
MQDFPTPLVKYCYTRITDHDEFKQVGVRRHIMLLYIMLCYYMQLIQLLFTFNIQEYYSK